MVLAGLWVGGDVVTRVRVPAWGIYFCCRLFWFLLMVLAFGCLVWIMDPGSSPGVGDLFLLPCRPVRASCPTRGMVAARV
jgi:hypothetical protein